MKLGSCLRAVNRGVVGGSKLQDEHILRMSVEKITRIIYESLPGGIRLKGVTRARWNDQVGRHKYMLVMGLEGEDARNKERRQRDVGEAKYENIGFKLPQQEESMYLHTMLQ